MLSYRFPSALPMFLGSTGCIMRPVGPVPATEALWPVDPGPKVPNGTGITWPIVGV